jgi:hypothetical protein
MAGLWVLTVVAGRTLCGVVAACLLSIVLYVVARRRKQRLGLSSRLTVISACAPFVGLLWLLFALLLHVQISNRLAHQDCGLSGDPFVTLPNGYVVGSHNTYDGYFVAPGFQTDVPEVGPGYVRSLIDLRFTDPQFSGTLLDLKTYKVREFVFDTRTRNFSFTDAEDSGAPVLNYSDPAALDAFGDAQAHVHEDADSYWKLYKRYRHHWPNYVLLAMILAGEGAIVFWVRKAWAEGLA